MRNNCAEIGANWNVFIHRNDDIYSDVATQKVPKSHKKFK